MKKPEKKRIGHGSRHWVFQYESGAVIRSVHAGKTYPWGTPRTGITEEIGVGDKVVLWKPGNDAGVFGFGEVVAPPVNRQFFGKPKSLKFKVTERLDRILAKSDLTKEALLRRLRILTNPRGAGISAATPAQFERLKKLARRPPASYWIFQANPSTGDNLPTLLEKKPKTGSWRISLFKDPRKHIRVGDKIVLWQVEGRKPDAAGVYAVGEITGRPFPSNGEWGARYHLTRICDRHRQISKKLLRRDPVLRKIRAFGKKGVPGSNFRISREQWEKIVALLPEKGRGSEPQGGQSYSYLLPEKDVTVRQRHEDYKKSLHSFLKSRRVRAVYEKNHVDLAFVLDGRQFLGEIKVTNPPDAKDAFRMALGQLFEYRHLHFSGSAVPVMFLDSELDRQRLALATQLGVPVVHGGKRKFTLLNPKADAELRAIFRSP